MTQSSKEWPKTICFSRHHNQSNLKFKINLKSKRAIYTLHKNSQTLDEVSCIKLMYIYTHSYLIYFLYKKINHPTGKFF